MHSAVAFWLPCTQQRRGGTSQSVCPDFRVSKRSDGSWCATHQIALFRLDSTHKPPHFSPQTLTTSQACHHWAARKRTSLCLSRSVFPGVRGIVSPGRRCAVIGCCLRHTWHKAKVMASCTYWQRFFAPRNIESCFVNMCDVATRSASKDKAHHTQMPPRDRQHNK